jgi:PAS domain S-box-containing protein
MPGESLGGIALMHEKELFDALCNSADGVFIVDAHKRILRWNAGAEKILGHPEDTVLNHECFHVLSGRSQEDQPLCGPNCKIHASALKGVAPKNYDMRVQGLEGNSLWLNVSILSHRDGAEPYVAHILRDITSGKRKELALDQFLADLIVQDLIPKEPPGERLAARSARTSPSPAAQKPVGVLSDREIEVLTLLAEGLPTKSLAHRLNISHFTARNHIQNILVKLNLHSKAQAVSYAFKKGIL